MSFPQNPRWIIVLICLFSASAIFGRNRHESHADRGLDSQAAPLVIDWEICDVGAVHNFITNSTIQRATGQNEWTILIGDDIADYPSMLWTVPEIYADDNHYLYYGTLRLGYANGLVHLSNDTSPEVEVIEPPDAISDFDTHFYISDQSNLVPPELQVGVGVHEYTYAWSDVDFDDFIIYDYWIVNLNDIPLSPFYIAFHADCDISSAGGGSGEEAWYRDDMVGYYRDDVEREYISYMFDEDNPVIPGDDTGGRLMPRESLGYIGSRLLYCPASLNGDPACTQTGHHWWDWNNDPNSDGDWYQLMSDGLWLDPPPSPHDYRFVQKTGPFMIPENDSIRFTVAFGIGEGLEGMRSNLEAAKLKFDQLTSVDEGIHAPGCIFSLANYPNPFNASTTIRYELPEQAQVKLDVYDILGRSVTTLIEKQQPPGYHQTIWRASNIPSGVYFYRLQAGDYIKTKRMVLMK